MNVTEHNTIHVSANLHPHGHKSQTEGPWSLRLGVKAQPAIIRDWTAKQVLVMMEQLSEETNLTLVRVLLLKSGTKKPSFVSGCVFRKARFYRRHDDTIEIRLKRRFGNSFPHPVPVGKYDGSCMYDADGGFGVFTLQACTLRKEPEPSQPKTIITPGDADYNVTLRDAKRTLSGVDGLGGRGPDAGGLRDGKLPDSVPPGSSREGVGRSLWTPGDRED